MSIAMWNEVRETQARVASLEAAIRDLEGAMLILQQQLITLATPVQSTTLTLNKARRQ